MGIIVSETALLSFAIVSQIVIEVEIRVVQCKVKPESRLYEWEKGVSSG